MIRVYLIDDHALVRTGFRLILAGQVDIEVVGEAASGEEGLPAIRKLKPDVVLCDLHLPGMSGLEITERIVRGGESRVIVVSVQEDGPMPRRLLEAGASGYLPKACAAEELLRAVREVARGKRYLGVEMAQKMALGGHEGRTPFDALSPRELEVAMMLCRGIRPDDIARKLSVSPKTVATHKARLLQKLDVGDAMAMARMAAQYGLVEAH
ncbi:MAG: response regulator [Proteobacteria bacterium]|nr:response regulator [Pseudomonadota bacterium]